METFEHYLENSFGAPVNRFSPFNASPQQRQNPAMTQFANKVNHSERVTYVDKAIDGVENSLRTFHTKGADMSSILPKFREFKDAWEQEKSGLNSYV